MAFQIGGFFFAPGDAFVYSGKILHGGGANLTADRWRRALHLSFVVGWLTPEEANALDYAPGELDERSPRVQRLLGPEAGMFLGYSSSRLASCWE